MGWYHKRRDIIRNNQVGENEIFLRQGEVEVYLTKVRDVDI